jgi:hypothetical protein
MKLRSSRPLAAIAAIVFVAAVGAYTLYWHITAGRVVAGLDAWRAARAAEGYAVTWQSPSIGGFPFRFRIALADATIARGEPAMYRVTAPVLSGEASPLNLMRWHVTAPQGGTGTAQGIAGPVSAASMSGDIVLGSDESELIVAALGLDGAGVSAGEVDAHLILPRRAPANHRELDLAGAMQAYHLVLPKPVTPLGNVIEGASVTLRIMGEIAPGDLRASLAAWRDDGGTIELEGAELQWGALSLSLSGTVALDPRLQPVAATTATIVDQDALIDASVAAGMLPADNAGFVKLVLGLLAKPGLDGHSSITAPVTLQDGKVSIGKAVIAKLPPLSFE